MYLKGKALELYKKFFNLNTRDEIAEYENAKRCTLICVDEIIQTLKNDWMNAPNSNDLLNDWQEVKNEAEKL